MERSKKFNIAGLCIPQYHYMADVSDKVNHIISEYIEQEEYFTINRARQYGKTTILYLLQEKLKERCVVLSITFEGKEEYFSSLQNFAEGLNVSFYKSLRKLYPGLSGIFQERICHTLAMEEMGDRITALCEQAGKPVVLMIDEVDKAADNQVFLTFLGMLRERYLKRRIGGDRTFDSVILAGVHDVKNLKMRIRPEEGQTYNSPWNISAIFEVDMGFSVNEIESMLREYENDMHTGMDIPGIARELHGYTDGYPFLVSCLCKLIDEKKLTWDKIGLRSAVKELLRTNNTLFEDVIKNIREHREFSELVEQIVLQGTQVAFEIRNPTIQQGVMYGILKEQDGKTAVSNVLFETLIINYFVSVRSTYALTSSGYVESGQYVRNGLLELEVWHGEKYEQDGYDQLVRYLDARGLEKGYLLSFCDNKKTPRKNRTFWHSGYEICEVIIAYRDV